MIETTGIGALLNHWRCGDSYLDRKREAFFDRIYKEVIGEDETYDANEDPEYADVIERNWLRGEQRKALDKIRDECR